MPIFPITTPIDVFQRQTAVLRASLPGVFDGRADSVHDARIATRRIRAVVPLIHDWHSCRGVQHLSVMFTRMGTLLGRVRDVDGRIALLRYIEARMPTAAASLVRIRQQQERDRLRRIRKLVKRLERLDVEQALGQSAAAIRSRSHRWLAVTGAWRTDVRRVIDQRARDAADAIAHATTVYFPNRAHRARIAVKKLRYAVEIGAQTGVPIGDRLIRTLKRGQDELGELRDRQALIDELRDMTDSAGDGDDQVRERQAIAQFVAAEMSDLHRRFVERRPGLLEAVEEARRIVRRSQVPASTLAVATAVAVAGVFALRRRAPAAEPISSDAVEFRIPVAVRLGWNDDEAGDSERRG